MKKLLKYFTVLMLILSLCGCGSLRTSKDAYDSVFEPGTKLSVDGGQIELVKVHLLFQMDIKYLVEKRVLLLL